VQLPPQLLGDLDHILLMELTVRNYLHYLTKRELLYAPRNRVGYHVVMG
jgi:hypothetical protein